MDDADGWYSNAGRNLPASGDWSTSLADCDHLRVVRGSRQWHRADGSLVPDTCQIVRGTTGNGGGQAADQSGLAPAPPQFSQAAAYREPKLPKLMVYRPP